jgi:hypothetical protein
VSASDVWAVGNSTGFEGAPQLVLHWQGLSWTVDGSPAFDGPGALDEVQADPAGNVWAVGDGRAAPGGESETLADRWDGSSWTPHDPLNPYVDDYLSDVLPISATDVWVAGTSNTTATGMKRGVVQHWDGRTWSLSEILTPGAWSYANAISGSPNDIVVVGQGNPNTIPSHGLTLIQRWNGSSWEMMSSPSPGTRRNELLDVTRVGDEWWAVGYATDGAEQKHTLILRACGI